MEEAEVATMRRKTKLFCEISSPRIWCGKKHPKPAWASVEVQETGGSFGTALCGPALEELPGAHDRKYIARTFCRVSIACALLSVGKKKKIPNAN